MSDAYVSPAAVSAVSAPPLDGPSTPGLINAVQFGFFPHAFAERNVRRYGRVAAWTQKETLMGRGILLWLLGIPIPIIILLALFWR